MEQGTSNIFKPLCRFHEGDNEKEHACYLLQRLLQNQENTERQLDCNHLECIIKQNIGNCPQLCLENGKEYWGLAGGTTTKRRPRY